MSVSQSLSAHSHSGNIRQDNRLVESYQTITMREKRFIISAAFKLQEQERRFLQTPGSDASQFVPQKISYSRSEICAIIDANFTFIEVEAFLEKLWQREVLIKVESAETLADKRRKPKERIRARWLNSVTSRPVYADDAQTGAESEVRGDFVIAVGEEIVPFLINLQKLYTNLDIRILLSFSSIYAARLYEMSCSFRNQETRTKDYAVEEFRRMFGIEEKEHKRFDNFRKFVLDSSQREVNANSDIRCNYEILTDKKELVGKGGRGKRPAFIRVQITEDSGARLRKKAGGGKVPEDARPLEGPVTDVPQLPLALDMEDAHHAHLVRLGMTPEQASEIVGACPPELVAKALVDASKPKVKNKAAYLAEVLIHKFKAGTATLPPAPRSSRKPSATKPKPPVAEPEAWLADWSRLMPGPPPATYDAAPEEFKTSFQARIDAGFQGLKDFLMRAKSGGEEKMP